MFHILGIIFIIILAVLVIGLSIIGTVVRRIFGLGKQRTSTGRYSAYNGKKQQADASSKEKVTNPEEESSAKRKKLFARDEGEYVEFEEVKE